MKHARPLRFKRDRSFVLLEVTVALIILAVAMTGILRGFVIGLNSIRMNKIALSATLLAESMLEDFELEPPIEGRDEGEFADDDRFGEDFKNFKWRYQVKEEEVDYDDIPKDPLQEPEPLYELELDIIYDDGRHQPFVPVSVTTYLLDTQLFSTDALQSSQLF